MDKKIVKIKEDRLNERVSAAIYRGSFRHLFPAETGHIWPNLNNPPSLSPSPHLSTTSLNRYYSKSPQKSPKTSPKPSPANSSLNSSQNVFVAE